jgi:hypothetical protein
MQDKRRFWQIHLATAIALAIAAGSLVWMNTTRQHEQDFIFGWPFKAATTNLGTIEAQDGTVEEGHFLLSGVGFYWLHCFYNATIAAKILFLTGITVETFLRSRAKAIKEGRLLTFQRSSLIVGLISLMFLLSIFIFERSQWYRNQGPDEMYFRRWGFPLIAFAEFRTRRPDTVNDQLPWYESVMPLRCRPLLSLKTENGMIFSRQIGSGLIFIADVVFCMLSVLASMGIAEFFIRRIAR